MKRWIRHVFFVQMATVIACASPPLPVFDSGGPQDLAEPPADQRALDIRPVLSGTFLLATGTQPLLLGATQGSEAVAYYDGSDQFAVPTFPGIAPLKLAQNRFTVSGTVSGNAVVSLYDYKDAAAHLSAWAPGDGAASELDGRAFASRAALAASPSGRFVAYVRVADLTGETGHIQIRRRDGSGVAVSPAEMRDIDLLRCLTELRFYDETHLVAFYCPKASGVARLAAANAETGTVVPLSDTTRENVEQLQFVPGARILWTNQLSSTLDPGALKGATIDGAVRQVLQKSVPRKNVAQLTLSSDGGTAYYLTATGGLQKVSAQTGAELLLTAEKVDRIAGVSPDGGSIAVTRLRAMMTDRLSVIDTATKVSVDPPVGTGLVLMPQVFSADGSLCLYITDNDTLAAYPVRGAPKRTDVRLKVSRFVPLTGAVVLVLSDAVLGANATASLIDARDPQKTFEVDRGLNPSPSGFFLVTPDRSKLLYIKGNGVYMSTLM